MTLLAACRQVALYLTTDSRKTDRTPRITIAE